MLPKLRRDEINLHMISKHTCAYIHTNSYPLCELSLFKFLTGKGMLEIIQW